MQPPAAIKKATRLKLRTGGAAWRPPQAAMRLSRGRHRRRCAFREAATGGDAPFERPPSRQLQIDFGEVTCTAILTDLRLPSIIDKYICLAGLPGCRWNGAAAVGHWQRTCVILAQPSACSEVRVQ
jgi:hypothetical protein